MADARVRVLFQTDQVIREARDDGYPGMDLENGPMPRRRDYDVVLESDGRDVLTPDGHEVGLIATPFEIAEHYYTQCQIRERPWRLGERSMMVRDIIEIDGVPYMVASIGFARMAWEA
jgi:hypothetical protein